MSRRSVLRRKPFELQKFIKTQEEWFPNYPNNTVRVTLSRRPNIGPPDPEIGKPYTVTVEGLDDHGMTLWTHHLNQAIDTHNSICNHITKKELTVLGLQPW